MVSQTNGRILDPRDNALAVDDWWEHHHRGRGDCRFWLTGSHAQHVWFPLAIESRLRAGAAVLNIGVGLGHCTRALVRRRCIVHALDIAPAALAKVERIVAGTWLASNLSALPANTFDVAISHLVAQHMSDEQLEAQLVAVIRALKQDGVFALQFGTALDLAANDASAVSLEALKKGSAVRSLGHVARMAERAGGCVVWANRLGIFPNERSVWYGVHITRPDFSAKSTVAPASSLAANLRFAILSLMSLPTRLRQRFSTSQTAAPQ